MKWITEGIADLEADKPTLKAFAVGVSFSLVLIAIALALAPVGHYVAKWYCYWFFKVT